MFFSTLTLRYDPEEARIDDAAFQAFARDKEILSVKEHFFIYRELPHLALCISWRMPEPKRAAAPGGVKEAWRKLLKTPEEEERFSRLRLSLNRRVTRIAPAWSGIPFLGFCVLPQGLRVRRETWKRYGRNAGGSSNRINRGGSWNNNARNCRTANRNRNDPGNRNDNLGFRPAFECASAVCANRCTARPRRVSTDARPRLSARLVPRPGEEGSTDPCVAESLPNGCNK